MQKQGSRGRTLQRTGSLSLSRGYFRQITNAHSYHLNARLFMNIIKVIFFPPAVAIGSKWQHDEYQDPFAIDADDWLVTVTDFKDGFVQFTRASGGSDSASLFDFLTTHNERSPQ